MLQKATELFYWYEVPVLLCGLACGTILDPTEIAITYLIFTATLPIVILDIPWHVLLFKFSWDAVFIICALLFKTPNIFLNDLVNTLMCNICSFACLIIVISSRLDELRNHRKAVQADRMDDLTGLWNHRYFSQCSSQIVKDAPAGSSFCIVYYDFNNIRDFNHVYGFSEGDRLQGYYYSRPLPLDAIYEHASSPEGLAFENHDCAAFYDQVSRVNLSEPLSYYYDPIVSGLTDSLPAAISVWNDREGTLLILRANGAFMQAQKKLTDVRYDFSQIGTTGEYTYTPLPETQEAVRECIRTNGWVVRQLQMKGNNVALYMHEVGFNSIDNTNAVLFVVIPSKA